MVSANTEGSIDINLTPDKRQIFIEKESVIWDALKDKLKEIFDKIAPPETGMMINGCNKLTNYFEEFKSPKENGDKMDESSDKTEKNDDKMEENDDKIEHSFSISDFKAKLAGSKRKQTSSVTETGKSTNSR